MVLAVVTYPYRHCSCVSAPASKDSCTYDLDTVGYYFAKLKKHYQMQMSIFQRLLVLQLRNSPNIGAGQEVIQKRNYLDKEINIYRAIYNGLAVAQDP